MSKFEKGILGYKKDPKNQVLFSFNVREGEECPSSDSEDSDYQPRIDRKRKSRDDDSRDDVENEGNMASLSRIQAVSAVHLPSELWLEIFHYVVERQGALPFLCRAALVCTTWREIVACRSFWERIDLSYGWIKSTDKTLQWLCDNRLSNCVDINLSSWKLLKSADVKNLSEKCCHLRSVNLSYCSKLTSDAIHALVDNCKELEDIDLSFTTDKNINAKTSLTSPSCLNYLISTCGPKLLQLNLSGNILKTFDRVFSLLMNSCPNLELFDISNCQFSMDRSTFMLPIEKFQIHCPSIRVLGLGNCNCHMGQARQDYSQNPDYSGFSKLEQLSLASMTVNTTGLSNDATFLYIALSSSTDLHLLDLRGCYRMGLGILTSLPATNVEELYLSKCTVDALTQLGRILSKWCRSLIKLDLSWMKVNNEDHFDESLCQLVSVLPSKLQSLNLAGTPVTETAIKCLLTKCKALRFINLTSCRSLSRGIKREYRNNEILQLKKEIL